jgi:hypothetical protein
MQTTSRHYDAHLLARMRDQRQFSSRATSLGGKSFALRQNRFPETGWKRPRNSGIGGAIGSKQLHRGVCPF